VWQWQASFIYFSFRSHSFVRRVYFLVLMKAIIATLKGVLTALVSGYCRIQMVDGVDNFRGAGEGGRIGPE